MTLKSQFKTLKENWLMLLIIIIVIGAVLFISPSSGFSRSLQSMQYADSSFAGGYAGESLKASYLPSPIHNQDFAPEIKERVITKTASLSNDVKQGKFKEADEKVKSIIQSTGSYLINENTNAYDSGRKQYHNGYYQIKVETSKYSAILLQLKELGEVQSFTENANDETRQFQDLTATLAAEKSRLQRYQQMYQDATLIQDKIQLSDKIFEQERIIKMYEDSLSSLSNRVSYSTIYLTLNEKQSEYADILWVKFSDLTKALVESINSLLSLLFIILPWALAIFIIWIIVKAVKKK